MVRSIVWCIATALLLVRSAIAACTVYTTIVTTVTTSTDTLKNFDFVYVTRTPQITSTINEVRTSFRYIYVTAKTTTDYTYTTYAVATTTITLPTKSTLKASATVTSTCPPVPLCDTYVTRTRTSSFLTSARVTTTVRTTATESYTYLFIQSKTVKSTITTGSPPTTKVTTKTIRSFLGTRTITNTPARIVATSTSYEYTVTETKYHVQTHTHTATPTIYLFSARVDLTNTTLDGYALGKGGYHTEDPSDFTTYNGSTTWTYFVNPETKALTLNGTSERLGWWYNNYCDDGGCAGDGNIAAVLTDEQAYNIDRGSIEWHPASCYARCGEMIRCYDGLDNVGTGRRRFYVSVRKQERWFDDVEDPHQVEATLRYESDRYDPELTIPFRAVGPGRGRR